MARRKLSFPVKASMFAPVFASPLRGFLAFPGILALAFVLLDSAPLLASPLDDVAAYVQSIRTSPGEVEMAELPGGCLVDGLTIFRMRGKIVRILYGEGDGCATEASFQLEQFFNSAGLPVYTTFRNCPQLQSDCISGQVIFNPKGTQARSYRILFESAHAYATPSRTVAVSERGIPACRLEDIDKSTSRRCYFASTGDVIRYLKNRLSPENLSGAYATIFTGQSTGIFPLYTARVNANEVRLRVDSSERASIIDRLYPFESAEVIEKGKNERIAPWGIHPWYRVKTGSKTGWIFGAFLDPDRIYETSLKDVEIAQWLPATEGQTPRMFRYSSTAWSGIAENGCSTPQSTSRFREICLVYQSDAKSNLNEAYLLIVSGEKNRFCEMEDFREGFSIASAKKERDNGIDYQVTETEEGAMSHRIFRKTYLTYQRSRCRAVIYHFHTTSREVIGNGNEVMEFDRKKAETEFDRVRRSILWE